MSGHPGENAQMRRTLLLLTLSTALVFAANGPVHAELDVFQSPSRGIACLYDDGEPDLKPNLTCEVSGYVGALPIRPKDCDLDWESRATIFATGRAGIGTCAGDTLMSPGARILAYGTTYKRGPFSCLSTTAGMRCKNRSGVGFQISKRSIIRI